MHRFNLADFYFYFGVLVDVGVAAISHFEVS